MIILLNHKNWEIWKCVTVTYPYGFHWPTVTMTIHGAVYHGFPTAPRSKVEDAVLLQEVQAPVKRVDVSRDSP